MSATIKRWMLVNGSYVSTVAVANTTHAGTPAYGAVSVGLTAVLLSAANANRHSLSVYNNGTVPIYIGTDANVTVVNGMPLPAATEREIQTTSAIYAISGTAAQDIRFLEETNT